MMEDAFWTLERGSGPLVASAIHHGHAVRPDVARALALDPAQRRIEEDPHTALWTAIAPTRIVGRRSRFEVDLNRPRGEAVYGREVWGLPVWKGGQAPAAVRQRSLRQYDAFYRTVEDLLRGMEARYGHFVVLDLHTYNHRRAGPDEPAADPRANPDVNVGTGSLDRARWGHVVDAFSGALSGQALLGRRLDVRENVCFEGGWFSRWVHRTFPLTGCALAIEVKKFFMDEWTGEADVGAVVAVRDALSRAVAPVMEALGAAEAA